MEMMMEYKKIYFVLCLVFLVSDSRCGETNSDKYITSSKAECFASKNLFSCIKYKTARFVWSIAAGQIQLFKNPLTSEHFNLIRIANDGEDKEFSEYRYEQHVSETSKALSFLKRSVHMFLATHGFQISFGKDSAARLITDSSDNLAVENRGKKKRALRLIVPLLILLKLAKLKILLFNVLLGIGGIQLILVAGGLLLYRFLSNTSNGRMQAPMQSFGGMSQIGSIPSIMDPEPEPTSGNYRYHYNPPSYHSSASYPKDWASSRAYSAFNNYMDTSQSSSS